MSNRPRKNIPCFWGSRMAIPLDNNIEDIKRYIDKANDIMEATHPGCEDFLNLLGSGILKGKIPRYMEHLREQRLIIIGTYKFRSSHDNAFRTLWHDSNEEIKKIARSSVQLGNHQFKNCVDVLKPEIRGGVWYWNGGDDTFAIDQEQKAWEYLGIPAKDPTTKRNMLLERIESAKKKLIEMENMYGDSDPLKWKWGDGMQLSDVFQADSEKNKYDSIHANIANDMIRVEQCV